MHVGAAAKRGSWAIAVVVQVRVTVVALMVAVVTVVSLLTMPVAKDVAAAQVVRVVSLQGRRFGGV